MPLLFYRSHHLKFYTLTSWNTRSELKLTKNWGAGGINLCRPVKCEGIYSVSRSHGRISSPAEELKKILESHSLHLDLMCLEAEQYLCKIILSVTSKTQRNKNSNSSEELPPPKHSRQQSISKKPLPGGFQLFIYYWPHPKPKLKLSSSLQTELSHF